MTLPHFGGLERLLATQVVAMTLEVILCQPWLVRLSNLVFREDREKVDKSLTYMFAKMMVANIYVFGPQT